MPNEVAADHNELLPLTSQLLDLLEAADRKLETAPHAAVQDTLQLLLRFVILAALYRTTGSVPRIEEGALSLTLGSAPRVPGAALRRLVSAFEDLERGIVDRVLLQPKVANRGNYLGLEVRLARVEPAVAMELLIRAGRKRQEAAKEVVRMLGENPSVFAGHHGEPWRIVAGWRTAAMSGDDRETKQKFDAWLELVTKVLCAREGTAADLVKIARVVLSESDHYA